MTHLAALVLRPQNFFGPRQKYMPISALNVLLRNSSCFQLLLLRHWHFTR